MSRAIKPKAEDSRWRPRRRGYIYCSPACGGACTYAAYRRARREARECARALGGGWYPDVWENLGWHWCVRHPKGIALHRTRDNLWWARTTAEQTPQLQGRGMSPKHALDVVARQVERAASLLADVKAALAEVRHADA